MKRNIVNFTISDIVNIIHRRRNNMQDSRIVITGNTGKAKSTCACKILFRIEGFDPWKHQVYNRKDAINLIMNYKSICFDDEAIETLYNRGFQSSEQQDYIRKIIKNRDHYNIIISVLPRFDYLDKHVKPLYFIHINMIHRPELDKNGNQIDPDDEAIGIVFCPKDYGKDPWREDEEKKIYAKWDKESRKNPKFKPRYDQLPTFLGVLRFKNITKKQREIYEVVKKKKKNSSDDEEDKQVPLIEKIYNQMVDGKLTKEGLMQICLLEGKKYSSITVNLNRLLKDRGERRTLKDFFALSEEENNQKDKKAVDDFLKDI